MYYVYEVVDRGGRCLGLTRVREWLEGGERQEVSLLRAFETWEDAWEFYWSEQERRSGRDC